MDKVHVAVAWYQKKIGSYDKQIWEQSVEQKVLKSIQLAPRRSVRQKTELIDVDLVRGSTFSRAKPQVSWTYITHKAITRVIFFPLFYKWWLQQMSLRFWLMMLTLYIMQVISCIIFFRNVGENAIQDEYSMSSVVIPILLMIILSQIHSQTVLSHFSHKSHHRDGKLGRDGKNRRRFSCSDFKRSVSLPNGALSENIGNKTTSESKLNTRKNLKSSLNKPDLNKCNVNSINKSTQNKVITEEAVCNGSTDPGHMSRINLGGTEPKSVSWSDAYCMASRHLSGHETPDSEEPSDEDESHEDKEVSEKDLKSEDETDDKDFMISSTNNTLAKEEYQNNCAEDILHGAAADLSSEVLTRPDELEGTFISPKDGKIVLNQKLEISLEIRNNCLDDVFIEDKSEETTNNLEVLLTDNGCDQVVENKSLPVDINTHVDSGLGRNSIDDTESGAKSSSSAESLCNSSLGASSSACSYSNKRIIKNLRKEPVTSCLKNRNRSETGSDSENDVIGKKSSYKGLRRRKPTSEDGSEAVSGSYRNRRPCSLGVKGKSRESKGSPGVSSSEGELSNTPDGSKATMSSEAEWEDRVQSDVTTSTYSSSCSDNEISDNDDTRDTMDESMNSLFPSATNTVPSNNVDRVSMTTISTSNTHVINLLQPGQVHAASSRGRSYSLGTNSTGRGTFGGHEFRKGISGRIHGGHEYPTSSTTVGPPPDKVSCMIWEDKECKKVDLTALDIGWSIIEKVDNIPESSDYIWIGAGFSLVIGLVPLVFCAYQIKDIPDLTSTAGINKILQMILANSWRINLIVINGIIQRLCLSGIFFFLLSVADRTFKQMAFVVCFDWISLIYFQTNLSGKGMLFIQRLLYAKHFCYLTSSRRAKKFDMPHFRLNKVRNIKTWLSLRSYLKKRGPQRSVDVIVSATCLLTIVILTLMCIQLLKDTDTYLDFLCNWELLVWCMALGVYLLRFMTLGLKINKKYRNLSVLITEQINLYLQMEQKPHKKEELMVANNVLKLAEDLLKELESPFKISGVSANPVIYNVTKVVVLSAFSAVLTELLGFKLKLYKIKLKA